MNYARLGPYRYDCCVEGPCDGRLLGTNKTKIPGRVWRTEMPDEPTPPATLPSSLAESVQELTADQLRALADYAEMLATHRERGDRPDGAGVERAPPDDRPDGVPAAASVTVKEINDNRYRYWQWRDGDTIKSKYIGPASSGE